MALTPRRRAIVAAAGTATVVSTIAGSIAPASALMPTDGAAPRNAPRDVTPRSGLSALVDARPEVIAARKDMLAARVVAARTQAAVRTAQKALNAHRSPANRTALAKARAAHARALTALTKAHEAYIRAEVVAIDMLRRNGRPVHDPTAAAADPSTAGQDASDVMFDTPVIWGSPGDGVATIGWSIPPAVDGYVVSAFKVSRDGIPLEIVNQRGYTDGPLANNVPYTYSVVAMDDQGHQSLPAVITLMPGDVTPPDATTLTATAGDGSVSLGFEAILDAAAYRVYQDGTLITTLAATATAYDVLGLTNGTAYSFTVTAVDAAGNESAASNTASATPADLTPPTAPTVTVAAGNASADLSWPAVADAASYRVYRGGTAVTTTTGTSVSDTGLTNGTTYDYFVTALDAAGNESLPSSTQSVTPTAAGDTTPPAAPTGLAVSSAANGSVTLTWSGPVDAAAYDVYQDLGGSSALVGSTAATTYTVTGLTNGTTYTFTVRARDAASNASTPSASVSATPTDTIAPAAPTVAATAGDAQVLVTWTGDADTAQWVLLQDGVEIQTLGAATHSASVTSLTNGTTYGFTVVAKDAAGNASAASAVASATPAASAPPPPPPDTTPPVTPTLSLVSAANGQASVSWSGDAVDTAAWLLYRNGSLLATLGSGTTTYDATGLTNGTSYTFAVYARDAVGNVSPASNTVTATPLDTIAPAIPTSLTAVAGNASVALSWNGPGDAVRYRVYQDGVAVSPDVSSGSSVTLGGLTNGTTYTFEVSAFDAAGNESARSTSTSAAPVAPVVVLPASTLTAGAAFNSWADLSWTTVAGASAYRVYKNGIAIVPDVTGTSTRVSGLTNGTAYTFTVRAIDGTGALGTVSNSVSATPVADISAPAKPVITGGVRGNGSVTLSWTESSVDATAYDVYYGTSAAAVTTLAGTTTSRSFSVTGLTNGTTYYFAVKARDAAGNTSAASTAWTEGPGTATGTFAGTAVNNGHSLTITVTLTVSNGQITGVTVPNTWAGKATSDGINSSAVPTYIAETLTAQTAAIAKVTGATDTWNAFKTSLSAALTAAGLK